MGRWNLTAKQVQEFKETEIGRIPVDWEVKEVKEKKLSEIALKAADIKGIGYYTLGNYRKNLQMTN